MTSIQWANPPANAVAGGEKRTKWGSVAGTLKTSPDSWGIVAHRPNRSSAVQLTNTIAAGKRREFKPAGSFEAAYAEENDGRYAVYARFVGEVSDDEDAGDGPEWDDDAEDDGAGPL